MRARPTVPLEYVINYTAHGGNDRWQLVIRRGQYFSRKDNETTLTPVSAQYLQRRWLRSLIDGGWDVVPTPSRMASLFYDLAFIKLPHWEYHVHPHYSRAERKRWSYEGVTAQGDLGNRTYRMVVEIAQLMRERLGYNRLYQLDQLNNEKSGDVLESIMGLQEMGFGWDPEGKVSEVSIAVRDLWDTHALASQWDMRGVSNTMYRIMGLDSIKEDIRYQAHMAKIAQKGIVKLSIGLAVGLRCAARVASFLCM